MFDICKELIKWKNSDFVPPKRKLVIWKVQKAGFQNESNIYKIFLLNNAVLISSIKVSC